MAQISLGIYWTGGAEPLSRRLSHIWHLRRFCCCSLSLRLLMAKLQIARLLAMIQLLEPCHGFVFAVISSICCKRRPRDTTLVLLIRDLYGNIVIQIQNNPGSPIYRETISSQLQSQRLRSLFLLRELFLLIGHIRLYFHFLSSLYERKEDFPAQREKVPQSQTSTTVEKNTKEMNIF